MRGVVDYSPHPTVAILDSQRPGESHKGIPVVGTVADALPYEPTTALVGVATQGGRFPPAWRDLLKDSIAAGLDVESGLHEFISEDPELVQLAARHGVELRDLRKPPPDLNVPTGENLKLAAKTVLTVGSDCAIGKKTVAIELDREARSARPEVPVRPDRPDGRRDRGLGHRDRRGRRRLHRRGRRAARRRRRRAWGRGALRRGPGLALASGLLRCHARAHARIGAARVRALPRGRCDGDRGLPGLPAASAPRDRRAARARIASVCVRPGSRRSRSTRAISAKTRPAPQLATSRRKPVCRPTIRSGSVRRRFSTPS